ncbi:MAG: hypothetical protein LBB59_06755 [Campylobacteraceae bacterium]|jgi:hypothetical protein|nr:hypothetical protein [Campylobacteraceae bacterium]
MKIVKTAAVVSLLAMLCASQANAFGKREQRLMWGAAAILTLPHLLDHRHHNSYGASYGNRHYNTYGGKHHYNYNQGRYYAPNVVNTQPVVVQVEQPKPQIIYVEKANEADAGIPMHRRVKPHNYVYGGSQPLRVIVEHADGTATVVER